MTCRLPLVLVALLLGLVAALPAGAQSQGLFPISKLSIATADGRTLSFDVEVAQDDRQRMTGLMHRRRMAADAGMLFDFKEDQPVGMWMKNTYIPLDMLFIAADGRVVGIAQRTVPHSLETIMSPGKVRGVLELNGGTAERLGIKVGDRVRHPIFGP